jgi:succinyl-diaminopimelate desuccinylase
MRSTACARWRDAFADRERIDWCITGEPSSKARLGDLLRVGRRGTLSATLTVRGIQGHVAYPEKAAIRSTRRCRRWRAGCARWDDGYEPFPPTSSQISNIHAGTGANNVIPGELQVLFNLRYNPNWRARSSSRHARRIAPAHGLDTTSTGIAAASPSYTPKARCARGARGAGAIRGRAAGRKHRRRHFRCALHRPARRAVHRDRPVNASIHKVDEHVSVADLQALPSLYLAADRAFAAAISLRAIGTAHPAALVCRPRCRTRRTRPAAPRPCCRRHRRCLVATLAVRSP